MKFAFALLLTLAAPFALSQTVYKCGKNSYSQTACPDAEAIEIVDTRDARTRRESERLTREIATKADAMERDRKRQEAADLKRNARPLVIGEAASKGEASAKSAKTPVPKRPERAPKPEKAAATTPKSPATKASGAVSTPAESKPPRKAKS